MTVKNIEVSIDSIKIRARELQLDLKIALQKEKDDHEITYIQALDLVCKVFGFGGYDDAKNKLGK